MTTIDTNIDLSFVTIKKRFGDKALCLYSLYLSPSLLAFLFSPPCHPGLLSSALTIVKVGKSLTHPELELQTGVNRLMFRHDRLLCMPG